MSERLLQFHILSRIIINAEIPVQTLQHDLLEPSSNTRLQTSLGMEVSQMVWRYSKL